MSRSSTEAEYRSVASATTEIMWIESLLSELKVESNSKATVWCDNLSTILLTANPILHSRTKHMELDLYFVREQVIKENLTVNHIPSSYQKADILTKPLSKPSFIRLRQELHVEDIKPNTNTNTKVTNLISKRDAKSLQNCCKARILLKHCKLQKSNMPKSSSSVAKFHIQHRLETQSLLQNHRKANFLQKRAL